MNAGDLTKLKDAFNQWAANHPEPDAPALFMGKRSLTARDFAAEIANETPLGSTSSRPMSA